LLKIYGKETKAAADAGTATAGSSGHSGSGAVRRPKENPLEKRIFFWATDAPFVIGGFWNQSS